MTQTNVELSGSETLQKHIIYLISLSRYFYETHYNIVRYLIITATQHGSLYQLQGHLIRARQL